MRYDRVYNFSAGPAMMPESVLEEIAAEVLNYHGSGMSVMEMSHRSPVFQEILSQAEADLRTLMHISDNYKVLFIQGGGTVQFAMVPMNLMKNGVACYVETGAWSKKAIAEAKKQGRAADAMYCMDLLNEAGVVCVPGSGFGQEEGTYHVRSTILPPENEIDQVVERMNNFHKKWMARYQ